MADVVERRDGGQLKNAESMNMTRNRLYVPTRHRYAVIETVLAANIASGRLPTGFVLLEGPIAEALRTTRPPVQRALQNLQRRGLIQRFNGRGYLVGLADSVDPIRRDIRTISLELSAGAEEALASRSSGERIYETVETDIASCVIFGQYRIIEAALAEYFNVSRTVVRDVLGRLEERGLVRRNQSSHWIAGPLTANTIREHFAVRKLLEPPALADAAPYIDPQSLETLLSELVGHEQKAESIESGDLIELERRFTDTCILATPNRRLAALVRDNILPVRASERVLRQLGLPDDPAPITEQRLVVEVLLRGAVDAAAAMLFRHLEASMHRKIAQVKIVAVLPTPRSIPAYLTPLDDLASS